MAEGLTGPGDFVLDSCTLVTTSGKNIDLTPSVIGITLYEGIQSIAVTGEIVITDPANLAATGPIRGHEYLFLKIRTPTVDGFDEESVIDFSENAFIINNIAAREPMGNVQVMALHFVSQELVRNQRLRVHQSFTASWSDIVIKILTEHIKTKKTIFIEGSAGIKKFVSPSLRPLDLINVAVTQAIGKFKSEPTYIFYENLRGINFRTLADHYNQTPFFEYSEQPAGHNAPGSNGYDLAKDLQNIVNYQIVKSNDTLINYRSGLYGSKLITHDIINKSYQNDYYNYHDNFAHESHITGGGLLNKLEYPVFSEFFVTPGWRASDFPSRFFVYPTTKRGTADGQHVTENNTEPYMAQDPHKWLQRRTSQMTQLDNGLQININVHGNTFLSAGDIVKINLPQHSRALTGPDSVDKFYKGPFLIRTIRHDFQFTSSPPKHQMMMNLVKDSLETELYAPTGNTEPGPERTTIPLPYEYF